MASSRFWHNLAKEFGSIFDPGNHMQAEWTQVGVEPDISWELSHAPSAESASHFKDLAKLAGRQLDPDAADPLGVWLNKLKSSRQSVNERLEYIVATETTGTLVRCGAIPGITAASANLCAIIELEFQANEDRSRFGDFGESISETNVTEIISAQTDSVSGHRTALLDAYKREGRENGVRITDAMIAKAASPKWNDRTPVQRWKRNDPRCTSADDAKIRAVLRKKPHLEAD